MLIEHVFEKIDCYNKDTALYDGYILKAQMYTIC